MKCEMQGHIVQVCSGVANGEIHFKSSNQSDLIIPNMRFEIPTSHEIAKFHRENAAKKTKVKITMETIDEV